MGILPFRNQTVKLGPNKSIRIEAVTESGQTFARIQLLHREASEWIVKGSRMVPADEISSLSQRMAEVKGQFSATKRVTKQVLRRQGTAGAEKIQTGAKVLQAEAQQLQKVFDSKLSEFNARMEQAAKELLEIAQ